MESIYKLFVNNNIILPDEVLNGGVLVNSDGIIEKLLSQEECKKYKNQTNISVIDSSNEGVLMAGIIDSHVHVNEPGRENWEGFRTATSAAAVGGITTIVDMPLNSIPPTTSLDNLNTKIESAEKHIFVDVAFWGGIVPNNENEILKLVAAGVVGFKCFLCPSGVEEFPNVSDEDLTKVFKTLDGVDTVLAFHAELGDSSTKSTENRNPYDYLTYLQSRPPEMEMDAIKLITKHALQHRVKCHIVHVSSAECVPLLEILRHKRFELGILTDEWCYGITAETCHHYLCLEAENITINRTEFKCAPPIRSALNKEKLWHYLRNEKLNLVVSDHSPCPQALKCGNFLSAWGGISSVQFGLPLFWTEARKRGFTLHDVTIFLSLHPAKLCGLTNKGSLYPGKKADIIIFDPDKIQTINVEDIEFKNKITPYLGMCLNGCVSKTYLRGELIYDGKTIFSEMKGTIVRK